MALLVDEMFKGQGNIIGGAFTRIKLACVSA